MISLVFYNEQYKIQLANYYLREDQLNYTALPKEAVRACEADKERYPVVILWRAIPVGFFVLHGWNGVKQYSNNRNAILMRAYSIDSRYQGRGFARQSLIDLAMFVKHHFPDKNEIVLAVNHRNTHAQTVYKKCGFIDSGTRVMGRKGELFVYHQVLQNL